MKEQLKRWVFRLLGKDPEAVVATFASGPSEMAERMFAEIRQLVPDRRHILIRPGEFPNPQAIRRKLRPYRIGLAPVLLTGEPEFTWMRRVAFLIAPSKILAYNQRLERHHLTLRSWIASLLFVRGVPLDRIYLRPKWLIPWKKDRSVFPSGHKEYAGRPFSQDRHRVGVLTPYFPYPPSHGGAVRMFALIREMAASFDVVLFSFTDQSQTEVAPLLDHCARVFVVEKPRYREPRWSTLVPPDVAEFDSPAMHALVERVRRELKIELLQVEYTSLAPYAGDILVEHDVTYHLYRQILDREPTLSARWDYWRWYRFEQRWIRRYRRVVVMSEEDRRQLDLPGVAVIPNGVDLGRFQPEQETPGERLLFIGSFRHFPNIVAFQFFYKNVWPRLKAVSANVRLTVVAGPDPLQYWRGHTGQLELPKEEGLEILGFVADVRPLYIATNIVLVPTLVSAGTNLKVIEALAMERAVVSTPSGCAGLGLTHGQNVWIANGADRLAEGIRALLEDHDLRRRIALDGRAYAERYFDWKQIGTWQRTLIRQMLTNEVLMRPIAPTDLDGVCAIQATSPESSPWQKEDYLGFDCTVCECGGTLAGFLVARSVASDEREILNIAVHPEYRRLGIASKLILAEIERWKGVHFLEVRESNSAARALYRHLGFEDVGVRPDYYDNPPESGIVMRIFS